MIFYSITLYGDLHVIDTPDLGDSSNHLGSIYQAGNEKHFFGDTQKGWIQYHEASTDLNVHSDEYLSLTGEKIDFATGGYGRWVMEANGTFRPTSSIYNPDPHIGTVDEPVGDIYQGDNRRIYFGDDQDAYISYFGGPKDFIINITDTDADIFMGTTRDIYFNPGSSSKWIMQEDGDFIPYTTSVYDIGSPGRLVNTVYAVTIEGETTSALWGDLAEKYTTKEVYDEGTVVSVSPDDDIDVQASCEDLCTSVVGVISLKPGYMMNSGLENGQYVALTGLVPVKIVGPINKSDFIVPTINGCARAGKPEEISYKIGVANEYNDKEDIKLVKCIIK